MSERGYELAKGDRRGFVSIDQKCEVYSVARQLAKGINAKQVNEKLGTPDDLQSVEQFKARIAEQMAKRLQTLSQEQQTAFQTRLKEIEEKRLALVDAQRLARTELTHTQQERWQKETEERQARYRQGLFGLVDRFTGKHKATRLQNEQETEANTQRDKAEKDKLIFSQMENRRAIQACHQRLKEFAQTKEQSVNRDIEQFRQV